MGVKRIATLVLAASLSVADAMAAEWTLDRSESSVTFETTAFSQAVTGRFTSFDATITLDPADLSTGYINAYVDTASVETGDPAVEDALLAVEGFYTQSYARATFTSRDIRAADGCTVRGALCFIATGTLTIRGINRPQELPFTLRIDGTRAVADGAFVVRRNDFYIGTIDWQLAGRETTVHLHIEADAAP